MLAVNLLILCILVSPLTAFELKKSGKITWKENGNKQKEVSITARDATEEREGLQFMITNKMRRALVEDLGYSQEEVDGMEPQIAAVVIERGLTRPANGMPESWRRPVGGNETKGRGQGKRKRDDDGTEEGFSTNKLAKRIRGTLSNLLGNFFSALKLATTKFVPAALPLLLGIYLIPLMSDAVSSELPKLKNIRFKAPMPKWKALTSTSTSASTSISAPPSASSPAYSHPSSTNSSPRKKNLDDLKRQQLNSVATIKKKIISRSAPTESAVDSEADVPVPSSSKRSILSIPRLFDNSRSSAVTPESQLATQTRHTTPPSISSHSSPTPLSTNSPSFSSSSSSSPSNSIDDIDMEAFEAMQQTNVLEEFTLRLQKLFHR